MDISSWVHIELIAYRSTQQALVTHDWTALAVGTWHEGHMRWPQHHGRVQRLVSSEGPAALTMTNNSVTAMPMPNPIAPSLLQASSKPRSCCLSRFCAFDRPGGGLAKRGGRLVFRGGDEDGVSTWLCTLRLKLCHDASQSVPLPSLPALHLPALRPRLFNDLKLSPGTTQLVAAARQALLLFCTHILISQHALAVNTL